MDQDSFRQLLQTPRRDAPAVLGGGSRSRIALAAPPPKKKTVDSSQPGFKPRTIKKAQDSKYRDRASERRDGDGNDYAHVEAVLEEFEKKHADEDKDKVEEQRKYLGGDGDHSILVKGLDFALLEQNKARTVMTSEDVDALDEAYKEASSHQAPIPKKRTREDILRELKEAREAGKLGKSGSMTKTAEEEARVLEDAKQKGKFKPIGFKPIGDSKKKPKGNETGKEPKRKKRKVKSEGPIEASSSVAASSSMAPPPVPVKPAPEEPEEPFDDDFDIFADAGEYDGLNFEDDDQDESTSWKDSTADDQDALPLDAPKRWIPSDESTPIETPQVNSIPHRSVSPGQEPLEENEENEDSENDKPMRLVPLSSSAVPSIKELLEMDKAAGSYAKNKKRKDKKKGGDNGADDGEAKKRSLDEKVDRDYKRLKTYTDKKAAAGKS